MTSIRHRLRWLTVLGAVASMSVGVAACGGDDGNADNQARNGATGNTGTTDAVPFTGPTTTTGTAGAIDTTSNPVVDSLRFFAPDSPWNTTVQGLPVAANSARLLKLALQRLGAREIPGQQGIETFVRPLAPRLFINTVAWAPLVVSSGGEGTEMTQMVCRQSDCGPADPKVPDVIALPPGTTPDPRYDGWFSVIDLEKGTGYDFWRARRQSDNTISFQFSKGWSLDGPGFSKPVSEDPIRATGVRGSGLPLFAGMISPGELARGRIDHALAISLPGIARRNFVQPASVTNGIGKRQSLPAGARLRLRAGVNIRNSPWAFNRARRDRGFNRARRDRGFNRARRDRGFNRARRDRDFRGLRRRSVEIILTALREYGAIVVDRAAVPTLYAPRGISRRLIGGNELNWLTVDDFEVLALPPLNQDPPLAQIALEGPSEGTEGTIQSGQAAGSGQ